MTEAVLDQRRIPGLSLTVLRGDETLLARGYGRVDLERSATVDPSTVFLLGSISKQFLAALVLALVEDGLLSLDDPVTHHLRDFSRLPQGVHVAHLLNQHVGPSRAVHLARGAGGLRRPDPTRSEFEAILRQIPVDAHPGSRWSYSNTNYAVLALLVERIAGAPYEEVFAERTSSRSACRRFTSARHCHEARMERTGTSGVTAPSLRQRRRT